MTATRYDFAAPMEFVRLICHGDDGASVSLRYVEFVSRCTSTGRLRPVHRIHIVNRHSLRRLVPECTRSAQITSAATTKLEAAIAEKQSEGLVVVALIILTNVLKAI